MAPYRRGTRGRGERISRGRGPNAGHGAGRGRGRGRGNSNSKSGPKSTFYSTRVEEVHQEESEDSPVSDEEALDENVSLSESSGDDVENPGNSFKAYSTLLQSLNSASWSEQHIRKKQKIVHHSSLQDGVEVPSQLRISKGSNDEMDVDRVDEPEENGNVSLEDNDLIDHADEADGPYDTFEQHFAPIDEAELALRLNTATEAKWTTERSILQPGWKSLYVSYQGAAKSCNLASTPLRTFGDCQLKHKLEANAKLNMPSLSGINGHLAACIFRYQDLLFCDRTPVNAQDLRTIICLHALNHVFKTRDKVIKNNARLSSTSASEDLEYRDQGFTRPKVLMLLPTRQACVKVVDAIISLCKPEQQENKKRFEDTYSQSEDQLSEDKPEDFRELFGGNDDDLFRLGIKFTRKTVKFFSQFYNSDIIFASPLGLRMAIGTEDAKKQDHDFLSSIELVIVDQGDALLMQNWEHVEYIFEHLNLQPKETHGCDFSRVRNWYLDGKARYFRQTILLTAFNTPELNKLFGHNMLNLAGKAKICKDRYDGTMLDLGVQAKQTFSRYEASQPLADPDARFKFFTMAVVPTLFKYSKQSTGKGYGILIFIPSYMDFVRVRNFLANSPNSQDVSFGSISEYTSVRDVARARSHFFSGRHSVLLYTGRAHHFRRYLLRGVRRIIIYALPDNPVYYQEIVGGYLGRSISEGKADVTETSVRTLFSKWDALRLERVVGSHRLVAMLKEKGGDTFDFV